MVTEVRSAGLTPAAMELQPGLYPTTNASKVTSDDDTNDSHHDGNSSATAALIISTTALLGSRLTVVSREAKKKQHACASSGPRDHYSELFTRMACIWQL